MRILRLALVLAGLAAFGFLLVYLLSEARLRDVPIVPAFSHEIVPDAETLARGQHIARTRGCFGCHGQRLEGRVYTEEWDWVERAVAPNLAEHARQHDDATLEAAIRHGIGSDGRGFWSMPGYNWVHLSDEDTAALIAFLRSAPVVGSELPSPDLGWPARWALAFGGEKHMADVALQVPPRLLGEDAPVQLKHGEYLAMTACNECHGLDLRGESRRDIRTPDLIVVAAYPEADFRRLMKEGIGIGGRHLGLMTMVARDRFAHFTEDELLALRAFLLTLPERPVPEDVPWRE